MRIQSRQTTTERYILSTMPVLYLPLYKRDSGSSGGSFLSDDGYGHVCTVTGALWTPNGRSFDGIDDYITVPDTVSLRVGSAFSVEAWAKPSTQNRDYNKVVSKNSVAYDLFMGQGTIVAQKFNFGVYDTTPTSYEVNALAQFAVNQWYHLLGTFDGTTVTLFIDGISQGTTAFSGTRPNLTSEVNIGCQNELGTIQRPFIGIIGGVRIYNRVLSAVEILNNYIATAWRY